MNRINEFYTYSNLGKYTEVFVKHRYLDSNYVCFERTKEFLTDDNYDTYILFEKKFEECMKPFLQ